MKKFTLLAVAFLGAVAMNAQILQENFDDITTLTNWDLVNVSNPIGTTNWFQGNPTVFISFNGADDSYIGANFNNTTGAGTISNFLITPVLTERR